MLEYVGLAKTAAASESWEAEDGKLCARTVRGAIFGDEEECAGEHGDAMFNEPAGDVAVYFEKQDRAMEAWLPNKDPGLPTS